jgi:hypothetical protein
MRDTVCVVLIYYADCHSSHSMAISVARTSCASLVMLPPLAKPVRILSYCGFDPLMGRPFALKSGRPC